MSPVSKRRKTGRTRSTGQRVLRSIGEPTPPECDCPLCTGEGLDAFVDGLTEGADLLLTADDPLEAELFGAECVAGAGDTGEDFAAELVPLIEERGTAESLATLLAVGAVSGSLPAAEGARRLLDAGVAAPPWAGELAAPLRAGTFRRFADPDGGASILLASFVRAERSHGFVVNVDDQDCHAATDAVLLPGDAVAEAAELIRRDARRMGVALVEQELDGAEFRWYAERALAARAVHDEEDEAAASSAARSSASSSAASSSSAAPPLSDEAFEFQAMAALLASRLRILPDLPRPLPEHGTSDPGPAGGGDMAGRSPRTQKMPTKRKKSDGPAPIYQIKVVLAETQPPIWRRLELAADTGLAELHRIIQVAFGWEDSHLHVFETRYGAFGIADRELGHRAEKPVTLEQIATQPGEGLNYVYDLGDDWVHEIVVERVVDGVPGAAHPRCTAGERAAPPEDCGGAWGYADLLAVLADPQDDEHEDRLAWLGLESAAEFDPDAFDPAAVTRELSS